MSEAVLVGTGHPVHRLRGLLAALLGVLHLGAVPCAMALAAASSGQDCEHCVGVSSQAPCMSSAEVTTGAQACPAPDRVGAQPRSSTPLLILPVAVPEIDALPANPALAQALRTGRHSGDPPLHLRHRNLRI
jgi:hypothetical protein